MKVQCPKCFGKKTVAETTDAWKVTITNRIGAVSSKTYPFLDQAVPSLDRHAGFLKSALFERVEPIPVKCARCLGTGEVEGRREYTYLFHEYVPLEDFLKRLKKAAEDGEKIDGLILRTREVPLDS